jgi:hypothetical protein
LSVFSAKRPLRGAFFLPANWRPAEGVCERKYRGPP